VCDFIVKSQSTDTPLIQGSDILIGHILRKGSLRVIKNDNYCKVVILLRKTFPNKEFLQI
jgi:hypothetical protein